MGIPRIVQNELFFLRRYIYRPKKNNASRAIQGALLTIKNLEKMYTQEQVTNLQAKLDSLERVKNKLEALQSITWLRVDIGYKKGSCCDLSISNNTAIKIKELIIAEYTSHVKALQDDIENIMIINPSKF